MYSLESTSQFLAAEPRTRTPSSVARPLPAHGDVNRLHLLLTCRRRRRVGLLIPAVLALAACDQDGVPGRRRSGGGSGGTTDSADGAVTIITRTKYTVAALPQAGSLEGVVRLEGTAPPDTTFTVTHDPTRCGTQITTHPVQQSAGSVTDVVVWLDDVRTGKPLPEGRRVELAHEKCQYSPRVQAAIAPSTVNVLNDDRSVHLTTLSRVGAERPLVSIPFTDDGQVVPVETAARVAGVVEARCREHPWAEAYVATFDHPYFAVTGADGRFRIDSIPPGKYLLKLWHPRGAKVVEQSVQVGAGVGPAIEVKLGVK